MEKTATTDEQAISRSKEEIIRESQRMEEATLYSSKGHFVTANFWSNFHLWIGIPMVIFSAIAGSSFFLGHNITAGILASILTILSAIITFLNPNERATNHLNAGNSFDALHNTIRIFRTIDCWVDESEKILTERLKNLSNSKSQLNQVSPQIPTWAYEIAKIRIKKGEGNYKIDTVKIK